MVAKRSQMAKIAGLFCIAALTAFAGIAQAHDGEPGGGQCGMHHRHDFKKMEGKLGLTDAQKAQAKAIFQGNRDAVKPVIANLHAERKNLHTLMHADPLDEAAIRAETMKIAGIQADLNVARAKTGAQFRAILTPSQLAMLKTMHQKNHDKRDADTVPMK